MIINLHVKVIYLIKTYPKTAVISLGQEHPGRGKASVFAIPSIKLNSRISINQF